MNRLLVLGSLMISAACGCTPGSGPSSPDDGSTRIRFLPNEPQVLVAGERRSLWVTAPSDLELITISGDAISELGREQPFGPGMMRLDVEGVAPGIATVRVRLRNSAGAAEATFRVLARGEPWCETEGPPPYCVVGRYRIEATELNDQCTGVQDSFVTTMEIARSASHADSATVHFEDRFIGHGQIGPDGAFFTVLPQPIGSFRDGREVILEPIAVKVAGFRVIGRLDVVGLFPSPDPVDEAPCERSWELEGERIGGLRLSPTPREVRAPARYLRRSG